MKSYHELFDFRGSAYDNAMQLYPTARDQEFAQIISKAKLKAGMTVADVPAGGGYLKSYLPNNIEYLGHEPCSSFTNHTSLPAGSDPIPLLPLPWPDYKVDALISLAGIHHIENKLPFFTECRRVCKEGGLLVISDVAENTPPAIFLDSYVGDNNSTGHEGVYLHDGTINDLKLAGWNVLNANHMQFHWVFPSKKDAAIFCHKLFDIRHSSVSDTLNALEEQLGFDDLTNGNIGLNWSLFTITSD
jgi:SAM-dependent methyltransferase